MSEAQAPSDAAIRVEVTDLATGESQVTLVPPHEYLILTTGKCDVTHTQVHANGTHVLTIKGRVRR